MTLPGTALRMAFEQIVAKVIQRDGVTVRSLSELEGRVIGVRSTLPEVEVFIRLSSKPEVLAVWEGEPELAVTGSAPSLLRFMTAECPVSQLEQYGVTAEGDTGLLNTLSLILRDADFDWEGWLAESTGGVLAHTLGSLFRQKKNTLNNVSHSVADNFPEYLQEELAVLPAPGALTGFTADLEALESAVSALKERVDHLTGG